jgi:hypothetical protein
MAAVLNQWLFGLWIISLTVLFSTLAKSTSGVLLGTGAGALLAYVLTFFPKIKHFSPASLMNSAGLLTGAESAGDYVKAAAVTLILCAAFVIASLPLMNKKKL